MGSSCARMPLQGPLRLHRTLRQHTRMLHDSVQAWIHHHFPTLCECLEDQSYDETMPSANRYSPRGGDKSVRARRVSLDLLLGCDIHWAPYATHRPTRSLDEVCFYSGWLKCGGKVAMYLPERVLRQFGHMQSIPCHPRESAPPFLSPQATALIPASLHFASYRDWVLTAAQRGPLAIDPWYAAAGYMRWYFWISHPYMTPLLRGDTPRPCEREAILEEQAGPLTSHLEGKLTEIRGIADGIVACGEVANQLFETPELYINPCSHLVQLISEGVTSATHEVLVLCLNDITGQHVD
ncbi:hypothetical protein P8452_56565 [Trifolium repens]|nr:hypothetical protein P8452_56565 [Trifolium repens]